MFSSIVPRVAAKYGLAVRRIGMVQKGYRNESYPLYLEDGTVGNLLFFKKEPAILERIQRADYAADRAAMAGLPVRVRRDARLLHVQDGVYAGLYDYLPGQTVPWEAFTKRHIKLTGKAMADMHKVWAHASPYDTATIMHELLPLIERMRAYFHQADVQSAMSLKLAVDLDLQLFDQFEKLVAYIGSLPGQQIIHMDMVRGNVLFGGISDNAVWQLDGVTLTGIIDFEKSTVGHPLFDIARTLAFLLVDSPKPSAKIYQYFLDSGYCKRGGQPLPDSTLLTGLIHLFLVHDFYKFLRHTPYESLRHNYHYTRTRDLLKTYGMISVKI